MSPHRFTWREFDAFCAGAVNPATLALLKDGQYSRRRLLLSALVEQAAARPETSGPLPPVEDAWRVLVAAEERDPTVVKDILMWPTVGVWLERVLRRLHGIDLDGPELWVELGFLHSLAAAAAIRVGLPCALELPVVDGVTTLPTVGRLQAGVFVPAHRHETVSRGTKLTLEIDDHTPYRRFSAPEPPIPLSEADLAAWRSDLDAAW